MKRRKKSKLQTRRDNPRSTYWKRKADALWGKVIHAIYQGCAVNDADCSGKPEAHHLISRSVGSTRHDLRNGIVLCTLHHKYSKSCSPHMGPVGFCAWLQFNENAKWRFVMAHRWSTEKPNYKEAYEYLCDRAGDLGVPVE